MFSTVLTVCRQEGLRFWHNPRLKMLMLLSWLLAALAIWSGVQQQRAYQQAYQAIMHSQQHLWETQGELNPHTAAHHGQYAFKTLHALSAWEPGLSDYLGSAVFLEAHKQHFEQFRAAEDQLRLSRFAPLSLASLFQYLFPLVLILAAYALMADERSNGTLRLLLLQGATPWRLFWGKALALNAFLLLLLMPVLLLGFALLGSASLVDARSAVFLLLYFLYWQIFIVLSLLLSAALSSARLSLMVLLCFWFLNALIVPRAGLGWLQVADPLPTAGAFRQAIETELAALPDWETRQADLTAAQLTQHGVKRVEDLPVNLEGLVLSQAEADETQVYARHFDTLYQRYAADTERYHLLGGLFPTLALQRLSQALAGTDFDQHRAFLAAAERYRFDYVQRLNQDIVAQAGQSAFEYTADAALWRQITPFEHSLPDLTLLLRQHWKAWLTLLIWWTALLGLLPLGLRQMKVLP